MNFCPMEEEIKFEYDISVSKLSLTEIYHILLYIQNKVNYYVLS